MWSASQQRRAEEEAPRRSDFTCTRAHPSLRQTDVASIEEEVEESPDADGSFERAERPPRLKRTIGLCGGVSRGDQRATRSELPVACGLGLELPPTDAQGARAKQESQ